jgi:hypothetical protein
MTGYTAAPNIVPSPWLDDISDEAAAILAQTFNDLTTACAKGYERQIDRHGEPLRAQHIDPDRPWMRRSVEPNEDLSRDDPEALAADFIARQLDLFRPEEKYSWYFGLSQPSRRLDCLLAARHPGGSEQYFFLPVVHAGVAAKQVPTTQTLKSEMHLKRCRRHEKTQKGYIWGRYFVLKPKNFALSGIKQLVVVESWAYPGPLKKGTAY